MKVKLTVLLVLIMSLLIFTSCKKKTAKAPAEKAINVQIQAAEKRALRPFIETVGTLNPYEEVIVSAEVDGILKEVRVDEGTVVTKGVVLAGIDDIEYILEVKRSEADLRQAEATLSNTKLEFQRKEALFKEQLVTQQQFEDVSTRLSLAEAELDRLRAALSLAKEKLKKTKMNSPLSGVVKERKVSAGDYVKSGDDLFVIIQNNPLKINFTVTEKNVGKVKKGQDVIFTVETFSGREFRGKVNIIYPSLEERTRTLQVEALVPNPEGLLKPSLFAHVMLYTGTTKDTIVVPITALLYEAEKVKIFVVEGDKAKEREVTIGRKYGEMMEIIKGLQEGEKVVVVGQQNLAEGVKVNVAR